jgi:hypothetical protein
MVGVLAAITMAIGATTLECLLFPVAYTWAGAGDSAGYDRRFAGFERPSYTNWATLDVMDVGIAAALAQGLRLMSSVNPRGPQDE